MIELKLVSKHFDIRIVDLRPTIYYSKDTEDLAKFYLTDKHLDLECENDLYELRDNLNKVIAYIESHKA